MNPNTDSPAPLEQPASRDAPLAGQRCAILLVEPNFMLRRTVALSARDLDVADVHEAASYEAALRMLGLRRFDGLLLAMAPELAGLDLIRQVREGKTWSAPALPIAVMTDTCDKAGLSALLELQVMRVLLKPVKARHILEVAAAIAGRRISAAGALAAAGTAGQAREVAVNPEALENGAGVIATPVAAAPAAASGPAPVVQEYEATAVSPV